MTRKTQIFPRLNWLLNYQREYLSGDLIAGMIVTVMLVPQSMAYAQLAGLPPQTGIYASIVPLFIYGLLGSSRALAVGPVAIVSLMVGAGISQFNPQNLSQYLNLAITLALLVGIIQVVMGILRAGFLVNFLSHPVLTGFINAAAIVIAVSQLRHLTGIITPRTEHTYETLLYIFKHLNQINWLTVIIAGLSIGILLYFKYGLHHRLKQWNMPAIWMIPITRSAPLVVVVLGVFIVVLFHLDSKIAIVGHVPAGLPSITVPVLDWHTWQRLLPTAITIALIGFMESISVAKSLASKKREKVDANQELIAIGVANLGAAFTGAYPVAGGIGRSVVNFSAGANTGLASIITAILMTITVMFLTPLFYYLPQAVLASIIIVAVIGLIDLSVFKHTWNYNRADAISLIVTFFTVLFIGVETGIILGVSVGLILFLWRTSQPHVAIVGQVGETEHYRNVLRHDVTTYPHIIAMRVDESLYFPNAQYLEAILLETIVDNPDVKHLVLICSAVNYIDTSALEVLDALVKELRDAGVGFYLAEVKGPVMDKLKKIGFIDHLGEENVFLSTHQAMCMLKQHGRF